MASAGRCPRGHELAENAVYCTVCWVRVEPEDPQIVAARARRKRRIWIPLFATSSVLVGIAVGGTLSLSSIGSSASVVAEPASASSEPAVESPVASEAPEPAEVTAVPLAATVVESDPPGPSCTAQALDQGLPCSIDADVLSLSLCVPAATTKVKVSTRLNADATWEPISSEATLATTGTCPDGSISAEVTFGTAGSDPNGTDWRLAGRDADGQKLWKSRLLVSSTS